jgi:hypothetical protein
MTMGVVTVGVGLTVGPAMTMGPGTRMGPGMTMGRAMMARAASGCLAKQLAADQHATDFAGAGADFVELGVA